MDTFPILSLILGRGGAVYRELTHTHKALKLWTAQGLCPELWQKPDSVQKSQLTPHFR